MAHIGNKFSALNNFANSRNNKKADFLFTSKVVLNLYLNKLSS
jgi:hypothetical protein